MTLPPPTGPSTGAWPRPMTWQEAFVRYDPGEGGPTYIIPTRMTENGIQVIHPTKEVNE